MNKKLIIQKVDYLLQLYYVQNTSYTLLIPVNPHKFNLAKQGGNHVNVSLNKLLSLGHSANKNVELPMVKIVYINKR